MYTSHVYVLFTVQSCSLSRGSLSRGRPTGQSSTSGVHASDTAVDGYYNLYSDTAPYCAQTEDEATPWWYVDLEATYDVTEVWITNKYPICRCFLRLSMFIFSSLGNN